MSHRSPRRRAERRAAPFPIRPILAAIAMLATCMMPAAAQAAPTRGIMLKQSEIRALPSSGSAWRAVASHAKGSWPAPDISDQDSANDVDALAGALYYAKTGDTAVRAKVRDAIMAARGTEAGGRVLALARNLQGYVLAADLIDLRGLSPADDAAFRSWLSGVRRAPMSECTNLIACHEKRPNNWGTHSGAARIAADIYLGDGADLARAATVLRGWLGERSAYAGFSWGDRSWQANPAAPVGINPPGATKHGVTIDGVLPDDQRRGGPCCTPVKENYVYEALQGVVTSAYLLSRQGYTPWAWGNQAIKRAFVWETTVNHFNAKRDDSWQPWLIDRAYGLRLAARAGSSPGKGFGYADWFARDQTAA
jgi:hypothetical protein